MADLTVNQSMKRYPSVRPTNNKPINQSINRSGLVQSFGQLSLLVLLVLSFVRSFLHSSGCQRCPCFAGAVEFLLSVRVQLFLQRKEHQSINRSFVLGSFCLSASILFVLCSSFLPPFIQLGTKMSLFCRSS